MGRYTIEIVADITSPFSKSELESRLVASLLDVETGEKVSDGQDERFVVVDYYLTQATPLPAIEV
ncbi:MAG: hypothetical protein ACYTBJ_22625 [Planctomycetota bacterium]|jgi:hypothetical protein